MTFWTEQSMHKVQSVFLEMVNGGGGGVSELYYGILY